MDIYVGSLPFKLKESQLRELFEQYGEVSSVTIVIDNITRQNKGFGFVEMPDVRQAQKAINELNGSEISGRTIIVSKSEGKKDAKRRR
ncbi:RNA-binding protein [Rhodocytophaga aerolata]|uniref:RNA-binding protein n=1 Tax=Rhodocytophaga aerolata TaxID=455078 RepID=A0ABT8R510_9BACT|nr:RNA-binding protein [Rhodocytophaga aerolata]MDO1446484.1 RNA-binding protein [Rhodocytophaga aerolata]